MSNVPMSDDFESSPIFQPQSNPCGAGDDEGRGSPIPQPYDTTLAGVERHSESIVGLFLIKQYIRNYYG